MSALPRQTPDRVAQLEQRIAQLERAVANLHPGTRDTEDRRLLDVLASSTKGLPFTVAALLRHAHVDDALAGALQDACLQSPDEIGAWLRDRRGPHRDVVVSRHGRRWRVTRSTRNVQALDA